MESKIHLTILTPYGRYFQGDVDFLEVHSEKYNLGILPNHAPLISTLVISKMVIKIGDSVFNYAIGGGVINVEKDKTTIILDSVERSDEIDIKRAEEAKRRAEENIENANKNATIDINRAKLALLRAVNRLNVGSKASD